MVRFYPPLFLVLTTTFVQCQHEQTYDTYRPGQKSVSGSYDHQQGSQMHQTQLNSNPIAPAEQDFMQGGLRKSNRKSNDQQSGNLISNHQQVLKSDGGLPQSQRGGDTESLTMRSASNSLGALRGSGISETPQLDTPLESNVSNISEKTHGGRSPDKMSSGTSLRGDVSPYDASVKKVPSLSSSRSMSDSYKKTDNDSLMQSDGLSGMFVSPGNRLDGGSSSMGGSETNYLDEGLSKAEASTGTLSNSQGTSKKNLVPSGSSSMWADNGLSQKSEQPPMGRQPDQKTLASDGSPRIDDSSSGKLHQYPEKVSGYAVGGTLSKKVGKSISNINGFSSEKVTGSTTMSHVSGSSVLQGSPYSEKAENIPLSNTSAETFNGQEDLAECSPLTPREIQVTPTWISSFPGSGSKMTRRSVEAITGLFSGDDLDSTGKISKGVAVAVTTHYPSHTQENVFRQKKFQNISRGILVLRNPMLAIPSIFRFVFFVEQGNERKSKLDQPPGHAWVAWRDEYLLSELKLWIDHTQWWLDNYKRENLHLLPFEYFVSAERGSDELQKLGNFLGSADENIASALLAPEKFCCVWEKMVNHEENDPESKTAPPYTLEQLEAIIQALIGLRDSNRSFPEFNKLMDEYIGTVVLVKKSLLSMRNTAEA